MKSLTKEEEKRIKEEIEYERQVEAMPDTCEACNEIISPEDLEMSDGLKFHRYCLRDQ